LAERKSAFSFLAPIPVYRAVSQKIHAIFAQYTDLIEPSPWTKPISTSPPTKRVED
jgi:hypothetical protein